MPDTSITANENWISLPEADIAAQQAKEKEFWDSFNESQAVSRAISGSMSKSRSDAIGDVVKNIISGALTGITDTASLVTTPIKPVSKAFAGLSEGIEKVSDSLGSIGEQNESKWYQIEQARANKESQAQYEKDIADGRSDFMASLDKIGRDAWNATQNVFKTGHVSQVVSSSLGSAGTDILLAGGAGLV